MFSRANGRNLSLGPDAKLDIKFASPKRYIMNTFLWRSNISKSSYEPRISEEYIVIVPAQPRIHNWSGGGVREATVNAVSVPPAVYFSPGPHFLPPPPASIARKVWTVAAAQGGCRGRLKGVNDRLPT